MKLYSEVFYCRSLAACLVDNGVSSDYRQQQSGRDTSPLVWQTTTSSTSGLEIVVGGASSFGRVSRLRLDGLCESRSRTASPSSEWPRSYSQCRVANGGRHRRVPERAVRLLGELVPSVGRAHVFVVETEHRG